MTSQVGSISAGNHTGNSGGCLARWLRVKGITFVAISAAIFSLVGLCVHLSTPFVPPLEVVLIRSAIGLCCTSLTLKYYFKESLVGPPELRKFLVARGITGFIGTSCAYYALAYLPIGDAAALIFTAPTWTCIMARLILKDKFTKVQGMGVVLSLCGVILIAQPSFLFPDQANAAQAATDSQNATGSARTVAIIVACTGSICSATSNILISRLRTVHAFTTSGYLFLVSTLGAPIGLFLGGWTAPWSHFPGYGASAIAVGWVMVCLTGIFSFVGQGFKTEGFRLEKAGPASMMRNLDIVFAFMWQVLFLGDPATTTSLLGAGCICISAVAIGVQKIMGSSDNNDSSGLTKIKATLVPTDELHALDVHMDEMDQHLHQIHNQFELDSSRPSQQMDHRHDAEHSSESSDDIDGFDAEDHPDFAPDAVMLSSRGPSLFRDSSISEV